MKILIVEDEREMAKSIVQYLRQESYVCEVAYTAGEAGEKIILHDYDCILLDITLPDGNGLKILEKLKQEGKLDGVIIISAKDSIDDRIRGLNLGADDYLPKPFHLAELGARVSAVIRRKRFEGSNTIVVHELTIDLLGKCVNVNGKTIDITRKEYDLLLFLVSNKNRVVTKNAIAKNQIVALTYSGWQTHVFSKLRHKFNVPSAFCACQIYFGSFLGILPHVV